ncbi:MAG: hypothetical protein J0H31_21960 [Alphaproteobacteria bacterium]|nr:hypothetical protein [Alphaproteobacteria bacterium]
MSKKYDVTIVETVIHTFTITVEPDEIGPGETLNEVAEEIFLNNMHKDLENHGEAIAHREVENVTPQEAEAA